MEDRGPGAKTRSKHILPARIQAPLLEAAHPDIVRQYDLGIGSRGLASKWRLEFLTAPDSLAR